MTLSEKRTFDAYSSKRISFILITKNRAEYLQKTLELHRELVHPDDELIVIDGLSSDNTAGIVSGYPDIVDVFISEPDKNATHAVNKGIVISRGRYIKHLADDDVIYPEAMEQAIETLEKHPEVDLLVCGGIRQVGEHSSAVYIPPGVNYGNNTRDVFKHGACGTGFVIRRSSLAKIDLFYQDNLVSDNEFALRAISRGANVKFCRINLFHHPIISHSVTASHHRGWERDRNRLLRQYCSFWFYCWYRWLRPLRWYYVTRWLNRSLVTAFFKVPGTLGAARALRKIVRSATGGTQTTQTVGVRMPEEPLCNIWDGGFS